MLLTCIINYTPVTKMSLQTTDKEEEEAHEQRSEQKHWAATPLINVNDGWDSEGHIENVLHRLQHRCQSYA